MSRRNSLVNHIEFAGLRLALGFFRLWGLDRASALGGRLARFVGPKLGVTRRARRNIRAAMPDLPAGELERIVENMWENLGRTMAEYAYLEDFAFSGSGRIEFENTDGVVEQAQAGSVLLISGHFANWELMPIAMQLLDIPGGDIYRHANNPYVNQWMIDLRERVTGCVQIPKGGEGARVLMRVLKRGEAIAMLADQKMNDGIESRFFGMRAMTPAAPAGLAVRYGIPIILAVIERNNGAHFTLRCSEPLKADPTAERVSEIMRLTQELNDRLEAQIRRRPHEWLWLHNRWPEQEIAERN
ncbi:KDO2-lipid IV(A) lauroyltransferase [Parvibaculum indicum]|uniref:lysophospholipid acyltransferase family protein n=1 Tax=Parvibaculum indicum TaxID=562969 RepID=UPI0014243AF2|nr:lauroyl acyltransferase [Parvibaculum indicum]NIJ41815.1 KDO2-lipid IV(A) lauroyltransferase [Parvibaculum indicum]